MFARVNFPRENMYRKRPRPFGRGVAFRFCKIVNKAKAMKRESLQVLPKGLSMHNRACVVPPARIWPAFR